ncbi:hypothetical protein JHK87_040001 [Glycine soja]|nr:hypothetical protein JHK87_040001 [Glycine soja]
MRGFTTLPLLQDVVHDEKSLYLAQLVSEGRQSEAGELYSKKLAKFVGKCLKSERVTSIQWRALDEINTGVCDAMAYAEIKKNMPEEYERKDNHLEQRDKLGLTSAPKGQSKLQTPPPEPTNALEKIEYGLYEANIPDSSEDESFESTQALQLDDRTLQNLFLLEIEQLLQANQRSLRDYPSMSYLEDANCPTYLDNSFILAELNDNNQELRSDNQKTSSPASTTTDLHTHYSTHSLPMFGRNIQCSTVPKPFNLLPVTATEKQ